MSFRRGLGRRTDEDDAHGVDYAAEVDDDSIAGSLDDSAMMGVDRGIDQVAAKPPQPRQGAVLVRSREPAIS